MTFDRLSILGVGLLGGSIGLALRESVNSVKITGYGHRTESLRAARDAGAIHDYTTDPAQAVRDSQLVVLCTPVGTFEGLLRQIAPALPPGAVVTDVGSTKRAVVQAAERILPPHARFVGSHPMAGSEKRGVEAAHPELFRGALCITTPTPRTAHDALSAVESFWIGLGMRITRLTPDDHDRLLAEVSHLPHALASALVAVQSDQGLPLAGKGFMDATRIAAGDAGLWRDIFLDNRDNLRTALARLRRQIDQLDEALLAQNAQAIEAFLANAERRRKSCQRPSGGGA